MIRFTVVTITYNAASVLQRTLDSVLIQTYPGVEHLIIDGASTDATLAMAETYKRLNDETDGTEHKVIITSEPDHGIYDAMNKALAQVSGDYVVYLNAGDFFPSATTLEDIYHRCRLAEYPSEELPAVVYGLTDIVDGDGHYLRPRHLQPPAEGLSWKSFQKGMLVCHQAFYARSDIARNLPYDTRYRHSADVDWCIRVMREAERLGLPLVSAGITTACYTEEGNTTVHHRASLIERFHVMRRHYGLLTTLWRHFTFLFR